MSWDLSPKCCHGFQESISGRQDMNGKHSCCSISGGTVKRKTVQTENAESEWSLSFQLPVDTPSIIKESAGWVTPNQTLTTLPTHSAHLLCTLHRQCEYFHFKQVQAYSLKGEAVKKDSGFFFLLSL